jgi:hypothetical protein
MDKPHSPPRSGTVSNGTGSRPLNGFVSAFQRPESVYVAEACQRLLNRFVKAVCNAVIGARWVFIETTPNRDSGAGTICAFPVAND